MGAVTSITTATFIEAPVEVCFDLSLDVDVHAESMAKSGERLVGGVTSGVLMLGETVTFEARHFGLKFRLTSKITELERPHRFVDEMVKGPFKNIWHEHKFTTVEGGTLMNDTFVFSAPFGVLGLLAERVFLSRYMARTINERNAFIKSKAELIVPEE